jgi:hypothetical protein
MALFTPVLETYGWELEEIVVVQEPTFSINPVTDFATFDWFLEADATRLTNSVIERGLAAGWEDVESNVTTPTIGSASGGLAETFAKLQKLFTDLHFEDCIDEDYNNETAEVDGGAVGFLTWKTFIDGQDLVNGDEVWFEDFCIKAGLTDGGGNYGFRYIADVAGEAVVTYPNSNRTVQAGDVLYSKDAPDIYLEDMLNALNRIKFVGWGKPGDPARAGRPFAWGAMSGNTGTGSSEDDYIGSEGWYGDPVLEFDQAIANFEQDPSSEVEPKATAFSKGELSITDVTSEYTSTVTSNLSFGGLTFTTPKEGGWKIHVRGGKPLGADDFDALGSDIIEGWKELETGFSADEEDVESADIGFDLMDTDLFKLTQVPTFGITSTITPVELIDQPAPYDWTLTARVVVTGGTPPDTDIFVDGEGNINGDHEWSGDVDEGASPDKGIATALEAREEIYQGDFVYTLFTDSPNETEGTAPPATLSVVEAPPPPCPSPCPHPHPYPYGNY